MMKGIVKTDTTFCVKNFTDCSVVSVIGQLNDFKYASYMEAVDACRGKYEDSLYEYLVKADGLENAPDADTWENMIYADDPRGVYDGEKNVYRNVTSMDRGAATEEEIDFVDALDATYKSLMAMVK